MTAITERLSAALADRSRVERELGQRLSRRGLDARPQGRHQGRELFYVNASRDMVAVAVGTGTDPQLGQGRVLFHLRDEWYLGSQEFYTPYDVAPDGRFLMARSDVSISNTRAPLIVVDNWFDELRARMQGGR
jgi:hypothetical protein